ncbi:class I SAM-dependent rRNA methyltransferase [Bacillus suaedae]|uniref:Class I SAM-dependent rRNA methyltransferase n=1 Tax=Halalkalibacter suaedae TaxID=2822140 RepID=A0A941ATU0_9BACI|nr:class I SAM-dependent rRNA methyltransferase [Bacillus suaedae]MBP3952724.1 class I SAM-dependent rRNA methyltransferase [Bacillus suaedae]
MTNEFTIKLNERESEKVRKGYPLIEKDAVKSQALPNEEGALLKIVDQSGAFLAKGYYGIQNKGIGWILSTRKEEIIDRDFFVRRINEAFSKREQLFEDGNTTAFRVFNGDGDGIGGITIDYYDGYYVFTWYSEGIYHFHKQLYAAFEQVTSFKAIYEKKRFAKQGKYVEDDDFVMGSRGQFPLLVKENGIHFAVYLNDGPMVGVFLDQRQVRKRIHDQYSEGKTVLNTFSYTGAFSAAAALGGAVKTTSVDLAKRSLPKTIEQFSVNGIDYEAQDIVVMDVFNYFSYAKKKNKRFDLIVLDPPSFARSKKHTFSAAKDYTGLLQEAIEITERQGVIVASTNSSAFSMKKFKGFIKEAFRQNGRKYKIAEEYSLPDDFKTTNHFPEGDYLKVCFIQLD